VLNEEVLAGVSAAAAVDRRDWLTDETAGWGPDWLPDRLL